MYTVNCGYLNPRFSYISLLLLQYRASMMCCSLKIGKSILAFWNKSVSEPTVKMSQNHLQVASCSSCRWDDADCG